MSDSILITGASGYLGGTLLARWRSANLPPYKQLYALVRKQEHAQAVRLYGAEPLTFDIKDEIAVSEAIVGNRITIVFFLIDALHSETQILLIKALAKLKRIIDKDVHLIHTSGAKIFSSHAGAPTDQPLFDDDTDLYHIQKSQIPSLAPLQEAINTNNTVIEKAEELGVFSYISVPCIVYGKGEGFGNRISIQTAAIVKAAQGTGRVYSVDPGRPIWPVCHVLDHTNLSLNIVRQILSGKRLASGRNGFYLASSGSVAWVDLYAEMAFALKRRGIIVDDKVEPARDIDLARMATALCCPKEMVALQLGGMCTFEARNGKKIGWSPEYPASHILEAADGETERILEHLSHDPIKT